jgi:hypothetical protein
MSLSPQARANAQRILDAEARRLLEERNRDAARSLSGVDSRRKDRGLDEAALRVKREMFPVGTGDGQGRNELAS